MTTFATRLAQLRQEKKMSQQELAEKLGISRSAVGMYEQGRRGPDFEILDNVAELFDVDFNYMLGKTDARGQFPKTGELAIVELPDNQIDIWQPGSYRRVSDRDQVLRAYDEASPEIQAAVRRVLGLKK